jgi:hypothetical protein
MASIISKVTGDVINVDNDVIFIASDHKMRTLIYPEEKNRKFPWVFLNLSLNLAILIMRIAIFLLFPLNFLVYVVLFFLPGTFFSLIHFFPVNQAMTGENQYHLH